MVSLAMAAVIIAAIKYNKLDRLEDFSLTAFAVTGLIDVLIIVVIAAAASGV